MLIKRLKVAVGPNGTFSPSQWTHMLLPDTSLLLLAYPNFNGIMAVRIVCCEVARYLEACGSARVCPRYKRPSNWISAFLLIQ